MVLARISDRRRSGCRVANVTAIGPELSHASIEARAPIASSTATTSLAARSACVASGTFAGSGSERPTPRQSNSTRRATDARASRKCASCGISSNESIEMLP